MYKQVFDKSNGQPKLIKRTEDEQTGQLKYEYDQEEYTEEMPPSSLYDPIFYRDGRWQGLTKEQWEARQPEPEPVEPSEGEIERGTMQMEIFKLQLMVQDLQDENASLTKEVVELKGGN